MPGIHLTVGGQPVDVSPGTSLLAACQKAGSYVPTLCSHPYLSPPFELTSASSVFRGGQKFENDGGTSRKYEGCGLCLVQIEGEEQLVKACNTEVREGMSILTNTETLRHKRQENLSIILADHPHVCLTCAQNEGCSLEPCTNNFDVFERCCSKFGRCEIQKVAAHIGISKETPRYVFQNRPVIKDEPLFFIDYNLCIGCLRCVQVCKEKRGVGALDYVFRDGAVLVGTVAPTLADSGCRFCGACVEVCPSGALLDKNLRGVPSEKDLIPCRAACPIGMDVPGYAAALVEEKFVIAQTIINEKTPFPLTLGKVCVHPCEEACRRSQLDDAISICSLKRFAFEFETAAAENGKRAPATGKNIAVVGSGPAGLTAAYYLAQAGHAVTVFESEAEPGGMLRWGIPDFRLPREVVKREIDRILAAGVELKTQIALGREVMLESLRAGYDAIFLAVGMQQSKRLNLEGANLNGVWWGLDFLRKAKSGEPVTLAGKVVVIGGGDVAVDAAMSALRLSTESVDIFCLEKKEELPAHSWQLRQALDEGVVLNCSWGPKRISGDGKNVTGVELVKCVSVFDSHGNFKPVLDESQKIFREVGTVIFAVGQTMDSALFESAFSKTLVEKDKIKVNSDALETNLKGVFAGGDAVSGPASVVEAIRMGRVAAQSIDRYLGGNGELGIPSEEPGARVPREADGWLGRKEGFGRRERVLTPALAPDQRKKNFAEIESTYGRMQGVEEASRCLRCHLRLAIPKVYLPPEEFLPFSPEKVESVSECEGVFQLLDHEKKIVLIAGTPALRSRLKEELKSRKNACYFVFEESKMYTQRETELLQKFLQQNGKLPEGNEELEGLF